MDTARHTPRPRHKRRRIGPDADSGPGSGLESGLESVSAPASGGAARRASAFKHVYELTRVLEEEDRDEHIMMLVHACNSLLADEGACAIVRSQAGATGKRLVRTVVQRFNTHVRNEYTLAASVAADISVAVGTVSLAAVLFVLASKMQRALVPTDTLLTVGALRATMEPLWPMAFLPLRSPSAVADATAVADLPVRVLTSLVQYAAWAAVFAPVHVPRRLVEYIDVLRSRVAERADAMDDRSIAATATALVDLDNELRALHGVARDCVAVAQDAFPDHHAAVSTAIAAFAAAESAAGFRAPDDRRVGGEGAAAQPHHRSPALAAAVEAAGSLVRSTDARIAITMHTKLCASIPGEVRRRLAELRHSDGVTVTPPSPLVVTVAVEAMGTYRPDLLEYLTDYAYEATLPRDPYTPVAPHTYMRPGVAVFEMLLVLNMADALFFSVTGKRFLGRHALTAYEVTTKHRQSPAAYTADQVTHMHALGASSHAEPRIVQVCMSGPLAVVSRRGLFICAPPRTGPGAVWPFADRPAVAAHTYTAFSAVCMWIAEVYACSGGALADGTSIAEFAAFYFPGGVDATMAEWARVTASL